MLLFFFTATRFATGRMFGLFFVAGGFLVAILVLSLTWSV
jgi:hypothetical protein